MITERLLIEEIKENDYSDLLKIYTTPENMNYIMTGKSDYSIEELKEKWNILKYNSINKTGFLIIKLKSTNELIGECALLKTDKPEKEELEIAYLIDKNHWNKGYGKEICQSLITFAFETLKTKKLIAGMYKENELSAKLFEKVGFKLCNVGISKSGIHFREYVLENKFY